MKNAVKSRFDEVNVGIAKIFFPMKRVKLRLLDKLCLKGGVTENDDSDYT